MKKEKYNYKLFIGFILGVFLSCGAVYGAILYTANKVYFNTSNGNLTSTNVQGAIDQLATRYATIGCPSGYVCVSK